jgi:hypothetical protein
LTTTERTMVPGAFAGGASPAMRTLSETAPCRDAN